MFADYPLVVKISAVSTVLIFLGIFVVLVYLFFKSNHRRHIKKVWNEINERFADKIEYILSAEASPHLSRAEIVRIMDVEEEVKNNKPLLKTKEEKRMFARLLRNKRYELTHVRDRHGNFAHMLDLFSVPQFLENEVSMAAMSYKVHAMYVIRVFKLPISPWVINKLLNSKKLTVRRLAMYASVSNNSDYDMDYFESDFFDETCCVYDEIELAYALQRRRSRGLRLPNLARGANMQKNPSTQCVFVRLMRRFNQREHCHQLADLFMRSKHKKLIEEISRTWGYLHYVGGEQMLVDSFLSQPDDTKVAILHAIVRMGTGKQLELFRDSFQNMVNPHVRYEALRCMYNYGDAGRDMFHGLESLASEGDRKYFTFFHNPITLEKVRLDKEQAYHPSIETVYNLSF